MNAWLESWTGLMLDDPWLVVLAGLVPLALWIARRRGGPAVRFAPVPFLEEGPLPGSARARARPLPAALQVLGMILVAVALARPVERVALPRGTSGIDVFLALDVSSSMTANDLDPSRTRLDVARDAAARFVSARSEDRIGLLRFARYPDLLCPPTLDHDALLRFLGGVELVEADGPEDQTGIGTAVARAAQALRASRAPSKVVILLTDGEENVATVDAPDEISPLQAARMCEELGIRVYTVVAGIGKRGPDGAWVPLDTSQVRELASLTGGRFFEARDAAAVDAVYAFIDALERAPFEEPRFELKDRFLPFLIAGVVLLLLARALRATVLEVVP